MGEDVAAPCGRSFERMGAEQPVAQVDDVNVLLDKDVAGEGTVPEPVAETVLVRRGPGRNLFHRGGSEIVRGHGADFSECAGLNFFGNGSDGRSAAALETDVDTLRRLDALCNFERLVRLRNIDAHRLFAVDMFARRHSSLE